jgi:hypothetical protein
MFKTSKKLLNAATALTIGATAIAIVFGTAPATAQGAASPPFVSPAPAIFNDARTDYYLGDAQSCRNGIWAAELKALDQSIDEMQNYINRVQSLIDAYPQDSSRLGGEPTAAIGGDQRIQDLLRNYRNGLWGWQQMLKQMKVWWQELVQKKDCNVEVPSTPMTQGYVPAPQTPSVLHLPDPTPQVFEPPVRIEDSFDDPPRTDEPKTDESTTDEPAAPRSDRGEEQKSQTSRPPAQETETGKTTGTTSKTTNHGKPSTANQGKPSTRTSSNTGSQKPATIGKPNSVKTHQPSGPRIGGMRTAGMRTSGFAGMHGGGLGGMRVSGLGGMRLGGMGFGGMRFGGMRFGGMGRR